MENNSPKHTSSDNVTLSASEMSLFLTINRTIQPKLSKEEAQARRKKNKNKIAKMKDKQPYFCQNAYIILLKVKNGQLAEVVKNKLRCKLWSCPVCAPINAISVLLKIQEVAELNHLSYFLTLTLDPTKIPPEYFRDGLNRTHKYITYLFNKFATAVRKKFKEFRYVWVIEFQKNGNAHLHILLNTRLDINFVREKWTSIGGGKIMKAEKARDLQRVSYYVSKYIAKGLDAISSGTIGFFPNEKRYVISKSCIKPVKQYFNLRDYPDLYNQFQEQINQVITSSNDTI